MQVRDVSVTGEAKNDVIPFKAKTTQAQFSQQVYAWSLSNANKSCVHQNGTTRSPCGAAKPERFTVILRKTSNLENVS